MTYALLDSRGNITEYPVYQGDIQNRFPDTSFTIPFVPPVNYVSVEPTPQPQVTYAQNVVEDTPENKNNSWYQCWSIADATPEQIEQRTEAQATSVRSDRNRRLADSDWTQLPDAPVDHAVWAAYRQALRDVTSQPGFPREITWPEEP